ncbi:MAG: transcription elongation factor subunit Spt4 [Candidatus Aenigmatarchaeota archaeon]
MAKKEKACKKCRRLTHKKECPACKNRELTKNWKGMVIIMDSESEIAETMGIKTPGKYAIRMR